MTRQSYLPSEIHWGCTFVNIIQQAAAGQMQHSINLSRCVCVWGGAVVVVVVSHVWLKAEESKSCMHCGLKSATVIFKSTGRGWPDAAQHEAVKVKCCSKWMVVATAAGMHAAHALSLQSKHVSWPVVCGHG
jgi:hypothetical protein